jgi:hypothetical protein
MNLFILALSRLVPLTFLVSFTLIGSRYVHDVLWPARPRLARWAFAGVCLIGLAAMAPYALRAALIVAAKRATNQHRWKAADLLLSGYDSWNGLRSEQTLREWAYVRMNAGDWRGAEEVLRLEDHLSPQGELLLGLCQYYEGNPAAESTLLRVPNMTGTPLCVRDYVLGRIAQRRGDLPLAYRRYGQSVAWEADFFPGVYHGARLWETRGAWQRAESIVKPFLRRFPSATTDPNVILLLDSLRRHTVAPDKEFVIVSD